jgi:WD40 repeat protein
MDFVPCPKCGAFNAPAATVCEACGSPLDAEVEAAAPLTFKTEPAPEPEILPEEEAVAEPAAPPAFEAAPEVLARIDKLEGEIAQKPQARALYLQLAQVYTDGKRTDLAAAVLERGIAADPGNVYLKHKLAQITGHPEPKVPVGATPDATQQTPPATPAQPRPAGQETARVAMPSRPSVPRPSAPPSRAASRRFPLRTGPALAALGALIALAVVLKVFVFPSTRQLVAGDFRAFGPVWSPTGRHVAFVLTDGAGSHLAVYDFASKAHRLAGTVEGWDAGAFSWSPDGKRIAYVGPGRENEWMGSIYVYDLASGQSKAVAAGSSPLLWRAGASLLAVCPPPRPQGFGDDSEGGYAGAEVDWQPRFCRIDVDSGTTTRAALAAEYGMAVSSLVDRVVFERYAETAAARTPSGGSSGSADFEQLVDSVAAGKARNVMEGNRDLNRELEARKYMEKRKAARGVDRLPMDVEVFAADVDRGEPTRVAAVGEAAFPRWTPAGDRILYAANGPSGIEFWTMREDGGDRQPVLTGVKVADPATVTLSSDGKEVFFVSPVAGDPAMAKIMTGERPADLHVARVGGGTPQRLSNKHSFKNRFAISPDGQRIVYEVLQDVKMIGGEGKSELWLMSR